MDSKQVLQMTRAWIEAEIVKAGQPGGDPFIMTSLRFALSKTAGETPEAEEAFTAMRKVTSARTTPTTYDVFTPLEALIVIEEAIASL